MAEQDSTSFAASTSFGFSRGTMAKRGAGAGRDGCRLLTRGRIERSPPGRGDCGPQGRAFAWAEAIEAGHVTRLRDQFDR